MSWAWDTRSYLLELLWQHAWLSAIPILLGFLLALPVGWFAHRRRRVGGVVLSVASVLYALPSLPVLILLPTILGTGFLSPINVIIALSAYALATMVHSAADAFGSVPEEVMRSAEASGFSARQRAFRVALPLAGPVLLAGLRVVSVSTVCLVSIGALVGVSSLGSLFTDGLRRDFTTEIVVGVVLTVVLAVVFDAVLVLAGRLLMPWTAVKVR